VALPLAPDLIRGSLLEGDDAFLLPLGEKVSCGAGRMRGVSADAGRLFSPLLVHHRDH